MLRSVLARAYIPAILLALMLVVAACGDDDAPGDDAGADDSSTDSDDADDGDDGDDDADADAGDDDIDDDFFAGMVIEAVVTTGPGGGVDANLQLLIPYLEKHLPGNPTIEPNYLEGAAGVRGGNDWFLRSDPDMSFLVSSRTNKMNWAMGDPAVEYDLQEAPLMLSVPTSHLFIASEAAGIDSVEDFRDPPDGVVYGGQTPVGDVVTVLGMQVLGILDDVDVVWGYSGDTDLELQTGEVGIDFRSAGGWQFQGEADLLEPLGIKPVAYWGHLDGEGGVYDPLFDGEYPLIDEAHEILHGEPPSGDFWEAFLTLYGVQQSGTSIFLHPDASDETKAAFERAFVAAGQDPEYRAAQEERGDPIPALVGDELAAMRDIYLGLDPAIIEMAIEWLQEQWPDQMR